MDKEYEIKLTLKDMDIIITALKYYPCGIGETESERLISLGKIMVMESKIYEEKGNALKKSQRS